MISGGGANSPLFMQIFADVFGITASRTVGSSGASLGSAICAAAAVGLYADIESAAAGMTKPRETFTPNAANGRVYRQMLDQVYLDIRRATDPVLERAYPIFH